MRANVRCSHAPAKPPSLMRPKISFAHTAVKNEKICREHGSLLQHIFQLIK